MCNYRIIYAREYSTPPNRLRSHLEQYVCPFRNLIINGKEEPFCIFNSDRKDKDVELFYQEFKKLYETGQTVPNAHKFLGFVFPKKFNFERIKNELGSPLTFKNATFFGSVFLCSVDFSSANFDGDIGTDFAYAVFKDNNSANFRYAKFLKGTTKFEKAKFYCKRGVDFTGAVFKSDRIVDFSESEFLCQGQVSFNEARFLENSVNFSKAKIFSKDGVDFSNTLFHNSKEVNFKKAKFSSEGRINFYRSQFSGDNEIDFSETEFLKGDVSFFMTQFWGKGGNNFSNATFYDKASFKHSDFKNKVSFINANFKDTVEFVGSTKTELSGKTFLFPYDFETDFRNVTFEKPEKVIFNTVNLSKARFLDTNFSGARFGQIDWIKRGEEKKRLKIYDEDFVEKEKSYSQVSNIYKQLRHIYETTGSYFEAGEFFFGEMEMRRMDKNSREPKYIRRLLNIYRLLSDYGESPFKAFLWLISIPFIFLPLYFFNGLVTKPGIYPKKYINYELSFSIPDTNFCEDFLNTIYYSISNIALGRTFTQYNPENGLAIIFTILENLIGVILISLFVLAMNRKFRRTKD